MKLLRHLKNMAYEQYRQVCRKTGLPFNRYDLWRKTAKTLRLSKEALARLEWFIYYQTKAKGNASLTDQTLRSDPFRLL